MYYFDARLSCSLAKILVILAFVAKNSKKFLGFFSTTLKNLANFVKNNFQELGEKSQKFKIFLGKIFKIFLVLLPLSWMDLVFLPRSPKIFLDFFRRSWKILQNLANLAKNICQDLDKKCQNSKEFSWQENQDAKHCAMLYFFEG